MSAFSLIIGGRYLPVAGVAREVPIAKSRPSSVMEYLGGSRSVQLGPDVRRTWSFAWNFKSPEVLRWLEHVAAPRPDGRVEDVWLLDSAAAQSNMLDPAVTEGASTAQPLILVDGLVDARTFPVGTPFTHRVRAGVTYRLAGFTTHTAAANFASYSVNGAAATAIAAPAGTGVRYWSRAFTPAADGTVTFNNTVAGKTAGLMLSEGSIAAQVFHPGKRTPCRVWIADLNQVLSLYQAGQLPRSGYTSTLMEVG